MIADRFIATIDEAMNHYDVRSIYSKDAGRALARAFDRHVAQVGVLAARGSATVSGGAAGGGTATNASAATDGAILAEMIFAAAQGMDENNVPEEGRYCFVRPAQYNLLVQETDLIDADWGGSGSYAAGKIDGIAGMGLIKTNNLPVTNIVSGPTAYQGDFRKTVALCMSAEAVGTVKLIDLQTEAEYDMRRQGHLVIAKYAMGHGILRPECAYEIATP